ncbi:MAG: DHH family phosphoesterase [Parahaliea sp.]
MADFDIFNGDADGLCALVQLRNAEPRDTTLITGVKRDIRLLEKVQPDSDSRLTVLDISFDKNREAVDKVLAVGASVFYCDHHFAGDIPGHPRLQTLINTTSEVCTSLLINQYLKGAFTAWAVVGTFGDNLRESARRIARPLVLSEAQLIQLENLGIYINYNGYGSTLEDLHFTPQTLYQLISIYADPFDFIDDGREYFEQLEVGYHQDMALAAAVEAEYQDSAAAVFLLPDAAWARRVSGVYSNDLANADPDRAHAVLTLKGDGTYLVSVRAPLNNRSGADELCMQFPSGGGRKAAAGINALPADSLPTFIDALTARYR